jgi:hypothetical protein
MSGLRASWRLAGRSCDYSRAQLWLCGAGFYCRRRNNGGRGATNNALRLAVDASDSGQRRPIDGQPARPTGRAPQREREAPERCASPLCVSVSSLTCAPLCSARRPHLLSLGAERSAPCGASVEEVPRLP